MSNETERNDRILSQECPAKTTPHVGIWTVDSVKIYFDEKINLLEERTKERFVAAKENISIALGASREAIVKAETANDKRFDGVNECRETLSDQTATFLPRQEYSVQHQNLIEKIDNLTSALNEFKTACNSRISAVEAERAGTDKTIPWIIGLATLVLGAVGLLVAHIFSSDHH